MNSMKRQTKHMGGNDVKIRNGNGCNNNRGIWNGFVMGHIRTGHYTHVDRVMPVTTHTWGDDTMKRIFTMGFFGLAIMAMAIMAMAICGNDTTPTPTPTPTPNAYWVEQNAKNAVRADAIKRDTVVVEWRGEWDANTRLALFRGLSHVSDVTVGTQFIDLVQRDQITLNEYDGNAWFAVANVNNNLDAGDKIVFIR